MKEGIAMNCEISKDLIPRNWSKTSKVSTKIDGNILISKTPLDKKFSPFLAEDQLFYVSNIFNYAKKSFGVSSICFFVDMQISFYIVFNLRLVFFTKVSEAASF